MLEPEQFRPPWYLRNGHIQTILTGFYKPKPPMPPTIEHKIAMGECGYSLVYENTPMRPSAKYKDEAVLLLHGLGSSHAGTYMTTMTQWLLEQGVRVFRADLPGAGPSGRFTPLPPHGACFEEIWSMLRQLRETLGIRRWRISGVSLGGNILLKMLATKNSLIDSGDATREQSILRAVAVAPPIRLSDCSTHMEKGVYRLYANYFLGTLRKQSKMRAEIWPQWASQMKIASFDSIRRFDETVTAPMAGFSDAEEYYTTGSSAAWLDQISVPTTVLLDEHDPIVPIWMFDEAVWSATTNIRKTQFGGHVGYLAGRDRNNQSKKNSALHERWADPWIARELLT